MNIPWHTILISSVLVSLTIYLLAENNDMAGWLYVFILLMGITLVFPGFRAGLALFNAKPSGAPQPGAPGQPF